MVRYRLFVFGILLIASCPKASGIVDDDLVGAWHNLNPAHSASIVGNDDILFIRAPEQLRSALKNASGYIRVRLNQRGDSVTIRQGCLGYTVPVSFQSGSSPSFDTLAIHGLGKFIRMDSVDFRIARRILLAEHHRMTATRIRNLKKR